MTDITEEQLVVGMAKANYEEHEDEMGPTWEGRNAQAEELRCQQARAVLAYLRAHASSVCHLLGGAGPEAVGRAKRHLVNIIRAPGDFHIEGDLQEALAALRALGGKEIDHGAA